jgi:uncharacterized protein (TIGR03437 family)
MDARSLTRLVWLLALAGAARAQTVPAVSAGKAVADETGKATIEVLFRPGPQPVAALQFDVSYATEKFGFSVSTGAAGAQGDKSVYTSDPEPGMRRVLIAGLNANAIGAGVVATFQVQVTPTAAAGVYPLAISQAAAAAVNGDALWISAESGAVVVPGEGSEAPVITMVLNAASYAGGWVSPGEIVVIGGRALGPASAGKLQVMPDGLAATALAGTVARFDGIAAPLVYTSRNQVTAVVPYSMDGRAQVAVDVEYGGIRSAPLIVPVSPTAPGIFTADGTGRGQAAILNEDGSVNGPGNPAARGSVVAIFATGEGQTQPPGVDGLIVPADGLRSPVAPVAVSIGGQNTEVIYAGSAAGQVCGMLQVNARVPEGIAPGNAVTVAIQIGSSSQPGVSLAVR